MPIRWPNTTQFQDITLDSERTTCSVCGTKLRYQSTRIRLFSQLTGPTRLACRLVWCRNPTCSAYRQILNPEGEKSLSWPGWSVGWDVVLWLGFRRFARHWSLPQLRNELWDSYQIRVSIPTLADYVRRYQTMVAAWYQDVSQLKTVYQDKDDVVFSIDGIQPEKGYETVYVVRELRAQRVWCAETLLSSATSEIQRVIHRARLLAEQVQRPVCGWISDKQEAFVTAIATEFPGIPHRWCSNHFLRDAAQVLLEVDSQAKVQMRHKVRNLRTLERAVLGEALFQDEHTGLTSEQQFACARIVLTYCAIVRGILNDNHGGPLRPPGWRMAEALFHVSHSLERLVTQPTTVISPLLKRLHTTIQRGLERYAQDACRIAAGMGMMYGVWGLLYPRIGTRRSHRDEFQQLAHQTAQHPEPILKHIGDVMQHFEQGLFCGEDTLELPEDNLELERWFKGPKGHERRIHGRQHVGERLIIEAPTFIPAFDAHCVRTSPFTVQELLPYAMVGIPESQHQAVIRHQLMRKARSKKNERGFWNSLKGSMKRSCCGFLRWEQKMSRV